MDLAAQNAQNATEQAFILGYGYISGSKDGKYVTGGKCFDRAMLFMVAAGLAILTDLIILCIPVYMMRNNPRLILSLEVLARQVCLPQSYTVVLISLKSMI
jgi:hypothetical protein